MTFCSSEFWCDVTYSHSSCANYLELFSYMYLSSGLHELNSPGLTFQGTIWYVSYDTICTRYHTIWYHTICKVQYVIISYGIVWYGMCRNARTYVIPRAPLISSHDVIDWSDDIINQVQLKNVISLIILEIHFPIHYLHTRNIPWTSHSSPQRTPIKSRTSDRHSEVSGSFTYCSDPLI